MANIIWGPELSLGFNLFLFISRGRVTVQTYDTRHQAGETDSNILVIYPGQEENTACHLGIHGFILKNSDPSRDCERQALQYQRVRHGSHRRI